MRSLGLSLISLVLLASSGCGDADNPDDDGAADADAGTDDASTSGDTGAETGGEGQVVVLDLASEHLGDQLGTPMLGLTASGGGIDVVHSERWANCCPEFVVDAAIDGQTITVSYMEANDCNCECSWELSYHLDGVGSGTWTVAVEDLSGEVTVP